MGQAEGRAVLDSVSRCSQSTRFRAARVNTSGVQGDNKGFLVARQKVYTTVEQLCRFHSAPFQQFLEYVLSLQFLEAPQYQLCQQLFEPLLDEPSQRPLARTYVTAAQAVKVQTPTPSVPAGEALAAHWA